MRKAALSLLLWTWTGTTYFFAEVVFKTLRGRPEAISWTMLALAILLVLIVLVRIIPHPAVRRSVEWFPAE